MEKNLAAFLREDTKTVGVRFIKDTFSRDTENFQMTLVGTENVEAYSLSNKEYTYITDLELQVEDHVIVFVHDAPKVAIVTRVDEAVNIAPKDNVEYKWIACRVDYSQYKENCQKNRQIAEFMSTAYRKNVKEQFREIVLAGLDAKGKKALTNLLKG